MPNNSNGSPHQLSSLEVQRRLTTVEIEAQHHQHSLSAHHARISYLERAIQVIVWAVGMLATGKSGDLADGLLQIITTK